jgi:hypothetical protein
MFAFLPLACLDACSSLPGIEAVLAPEGDGDSADAIGQHPSAFPQLDGLETEPGQLPPAQGSAYQHGQDDVIPLALEGRAIGNRQQLLCLVSSQPVSQASLRRGAGSSYAEVEFIGQDGMRYRTRWEARRSRGKPDGIMQGTGRTLDHVEGETLTRIAHAKTSVQKAIDRLAGLTFDQFCRTVLLPQGEFDSFLLAKKDERAELLEKLTGSEIYGRISTIVSRVPASSGEKPQNLKPDSPISDYFPGSNVNPSNKLFPH